VHIQFLTAGLADELHLVIAPFSSATPTPLATIDQLIEVIATEEAVRRGRHLREVAQVQAADAEREGAQTAVHEETTRLPDALQVARALLAEE